MTKRTLYILATLCSIFGIYAFVQPAASQKASELSVYETSVLILKDFVEAGDTRLGFASTEEFEWAWIDTTKGLRLRYLDHDTMTTTMTRLDTNLKALDRVIYPVFTTIGGQTKLRSAITFDSSGGVHPIVFEDSTVIAHYIADIDSLRATDPTFMAELVLMPQIENHAIITYGKNGANILPTRSLRRSLGSDLPGNALADSLNDKPIDDSLFIIGLSRRLMRAYNDLHDE